MCAQLLAEISTHDNECAEYAADGKMCSTGRVARGIMMFIAKKHTQDQVSNEDNKFEVLGCDSESCILKLPEFVKFSAYAGIADECKIQLKTRFKPRGPRTSQQWLTNSHIDDSLNLWAREFKGFLPIPFAMRDFIARDHILSNYDFAAQLTKGANCFACAINTDFSNGPGKHWTCVFIDCRPAVWTVEFFNSTGRPPERSLSKWLDATADALGKISPTTVVAGSCVHQNMDSECGVYVLFYIRARLEGISYTRFADDSRIITDAEVVAFRKHLFRD